MKISIAILATTLLCSGCAATPPNWQQSDGSLGRTRYYVAVTERSDFYITCSNHQVQMGFANEHSNIRLDAIVIDGQRIDNFYFDSIQFKYDEDYEKFRPFWTQLRSAKRITVIAANEPPQSFELPTSNLAKVLPADVTQCDGQQN